MGLKYADQVRYGVNSQERASAHPARRLPFSAARRMQMRPVGHSSEPKSAESSIFLWGGKDTQLDAPSMLEDACHDPVREFERTPPGGTVHHRSAMRSHRIKKRTQLRPQRLFFL